MSKLVKDATEIKIYGYSFKPRSRSRKNLIAEANRTAIHALLPKTQTKEDKQAIIRERMSDLFYMFGEVLSAQKADEKYEDYINRLYAGENK
jgi:hypothetical protein